MKDLDLELLEKVSAGSDCDDDCMPEPDHKKCYIWKWEEVCVYENDIPCVKL